MILGWAVFGPASFVALTKAHPLKTAFMKFFFLGTFGTILKSGMMKKDWTIEYPLEQAVVWGFFGIWIAMAFTLFSAGVDALIAKHLWFPWFPALSKSFWINVAGGYAWSMMVTHQYYDRLVRTRWCNVLSIDEFAEEIDPKTTVAMLWKTIWGFWLIAHMITFSLPEEWRVVFAAVLAIALGFLISFNAKKELAET